MGYSEPVSCFYNVNNKIFFNGLTLTKSAYNFMYNHLEEYLKLHKETKKVIFILSYNGFFYDQSEEISDYNYYKALLYFLFSTDITSKNIDKILKNNLIQDKNKNKTITPVKETQHNHRLYILPYLVPHFSTHDKKDFYNNVMNNLQSWEKIIKLLKEKNIDYEIIIPPYNALYLTIIKDKGCYNYVNIIKKFLVEKADVVHDFAFVNRITSIDITSPDNFWYFSPDHPNSFFGNKLLIFLFFRQYADKNLYMELNKNNIDKQLKKQEDLFNDYIKRKKPYIDNYLKELSKVNPVDYKIYINEDKMLNGIIQDNDLLKYHTENFSKRNFD